MSRRIARRHSFVLVYQIEFHDDYEPESYFDSYFEDIHLLECPDLEVISDEEKVFAKRELMGVYSHMEEINGYISPNLSGWTMDRINKIDRAIIRLGVYELLYEKTIPAAVIINEAVEIAKLFGDDDSPKFVNGILGKIIKSVDGRNEQVE